MTSTLTVVSSASALASAAAGGMMFVFSTFVMGGLDRAGPQDAIAAMRGINAAATRLVTVRTWFHEVQFAR